MSDIKVICFDIGGVLIRIATGWEDAFLRGGLDVSLLPNAEEVVHKVNAINEAYEVGQISSGEFMDQVHALVPDMSREQIWKAYDAWLIECYEGVAELLDELHHGGFTTACMSNTNPRHWETFMLSAGIFEPVQQLQHPHASHLLEARKPERDIYQRFEQAIGAEGKQIVYFDDLALNVQAALHHDWRAYRIDPVHQTMPQIRGILAELGVLPQES